MKNVLTVLLIVITAFLLFNIFLATSLYIMGVIYRRKVDRNNEG